MPDHNHDHDHDDDDNDNNNHDTNDHDDKDDHRADDDNHYLRACERSLGILGVVRVERELRRGDTHAFGAVCWDGVWRSVR